MKCWWLTCRRMHVSNSCFCDLRVCGFIHTLQKRWPLFHGIEAAILFNIFAPPLRRPRLQRRGRERPRQPRLLLRHSGAPAACAPHGRYPDQDRAAQADQEQVRRWPGREGRQCHGGLVAHGTIVAKVRELIYVGSIPCRERLLIIIIGSGHRIVEWSARREVCVRNPHLILGPSKGVLECVLAGDSIDGSCSLGDRVA